MSGDDDRIQRRVAALIKAAENASPPLTPEQTDALRTKLADAVERWENVGTRTVAALVGGTGSGKSSIFNAIAGREFAEVGVLRPTTRQPSACTWGEPVSRLLDGLGVAPARRMDWDISLARPGDDILDGLILLDLPDHDSVEEQHSHMVDALLPVVDMLVWVIDPQKYADHLLHEKYLASLRRRDDVMVVVLNHSDTLTEEGLAIVLADVRRVLAEAGLEEVPVLVSRAIDGPEGVMAVRDMLARAVANATTAMRTAEADIDSVASELQEIVAEAEPDLSEDDLDETVDELMRASGVDVTAEAIEHGSATGEEKPAPARAAVAAIGSTWASRAKQGLPRGWADQVDEALPSVEALTEATAAAIEAVPVRAAPKKTAEWVAAIVAVAGLAGGLALQPWRGGGVLFGAIALIFAGVLAAALIVWFGRGQRIRQAEEAARTYRQEVRASVHSVVQTLLAAPAEGVLARHRALRDALETVGR